MLNYYSVAFTAYAKYCQVLNRELNRRFLPAPQPTGMLFPMAPGQVHPTVDPAVLALVDDEDEETTESAAPASSM